MNISVKIWCPSTEWWGVRTKLLWIIKRNLEEEGIKIPFPQRTLWFANPPGAGGVRDMDHPTGDPALPENGQPSTGETVMTEHEENPIPVTDRR